MSILSDYARDRFPEIAAKAPDDATLEAYIRDRFPEIAAKVDASPQQRTGPPGPMGKYGGLPGDQANLEPTAMERFGQDVGALGEDVVDYAKTSMDAIRGNEMAPTTGGGRLAQTNVDILRGATKGAVGTGADIASMLGANVSPDLTAAVQPENTAQQVGQFGERMAEFVVPGGAISKGVRAVKGVGTLGRVGLEAVGQGGLAAGIDLLHGEDMATAKRDAAIAAAFPVAGAGVNKLLSGAANWSVNGFFKQTAKEARKEIANAGVAETLKAEQIKGLMGKTLKERVQVRIDEISKKVEQGIASSNDPANTVTIGQTMDGLLDFFAKRAKGFNSDEVSRIVSAKESIKTAIDDISGGTGRLDAVGLNSLRKHIGGMLDFTGGTKIYKQALTKMYGMARELTEQRVPSGVKKDLWRASNLINSRERISAKLLELDKKQGATVTDGVLAGLAMIPGPQQAIAGTVLGTKMVGKAFQYTPGRMLLTGGLSSMGGAVGAAGSLAPAIAVGASNTQSVAPQEPMGPPAPMQAPVAQPPVMGGAVGKFQPQIEAAAQNANVDPLLLAALVSAESGGNPNARSNKGAFGLTQVTPIALKELGLTKEDVATPEGQLLAGAKYLRLMLDQFNGNVTLALAAYNAGPGAVTRHKGIPPFEETQNYVPRVLRYYDALGGAEGAAVGGL